MIRNLGTAARIRTSTSGTRSRPFGRTCRVTEIDYTGHGILDAKGLLVTDRAPLASVSFHYETKTIRPLEVYVGGQLLRKDRRLADIYSCVSSSTIVAPFNCAGASTREDTIKQTSHYSFEYV